MHNIKSYNTFIAEKKSWTITKSKNGDIRMDNVTLDPYDIELLDRTVNRVQNHRIDKLCGGVSSLEKKIGNIKNHKFGKKTLTKELGLKKNIEIGDHGNVSFKENDDVFKIKATSIGKGEVLLSLLYSDVRMKNREKHETGDCAIYKKPKMNDDTSNKTDIEYNIEVKSGGSEFTFVEPIDDIDDEKKIKEICVKSIYKYICSRCKKNDKPLILILFDNEIGKSISKNFFWMYCGTKDKNKSNILDILLSDNNIIEIYKENNYTKPKKNSFAITYKDNKIYIHLR